MNVILSKVSAARSASLMESQDPYQSKHYGAAAMRSPRAPEFNAWLAARSPKLAARS